MRLGILTFHRSYNFGANLQAFSSLAEFKRHGIDAEIVDYVDAEKDANYTLTVDKAQRDAHQRYFTSHYALSKPLHSEAELADYCLKSLDAIVVGSDAVFRVSSPLDPFEVARQLKRKRFPKFASSASPYWLSWIDSEPNTTLQFRASLSASTMGTPYWLIRGALRREVKRCINGFDYLAVRDNWTKRMVANLSSQTASITPDPVFAYPKLEQKVELQALPEGVDLSKTVFVTLSIGGEWVRSLKRLLNSRGFALATLPTPESDHAHPDADWIVRKPLSPLEWYSILSEAGGYIGIRFHALVSCLANRTPVVSVDGDRFSRLFRSSSKSWDLCHQAGIQERFYLRSELESQNLEELVDRLFCPELQRAADDYAQRARSQFEAAVSEIINSAKAKLQS